MPRAAIMAQQAELAYSKFSVEFSCVEFSPDSVVRAWCDVAVSDGQMWRVAGMIRCFADKVAVTAQRTAKFTLHFEQSQVRRDFNKDNVVAKAAKVMQLQVKLIMGSTEPREVIDQIICALIAEAKRRFYGNVGRQAKSAAWTKPIGDFLLYGADAPGDFRWRQDRDEPECIVRNGFFCFRKRIIVLLHG